MCLSKIKKILSRQIQRAGFYKKVTKSDKYRLLLDELPENYIFKDGKVYDKPKIVLCFSRGGVFIQYFNTIKEAVEARRVLGYRLSQNRIY